MSDFSDEISADALELITEFGESGTFTRKVKGSYSTNVLTRPSTDSEYTAMVFQYEFNASEIDGDTILRTDKKLLVPTTDTSGAAIEPKTGDLVVLGGTKYRIKNVLNPAKVNGENVIFICQIGI